MPASYPRIVVLLFCLVLVVVLMAPTTLAMSLATFSDAQCTESLPFSYYNASLLTNRTKACFPTTNPSPGALTAYYVYCSNTTAGTDYVSVEVDTFINDSTCDHKVQSNVVWDVTAGYYTPLIAQGVCSPAQYRVGGDVTQPFDNQTIYVIVRCDAATGPPSPTPQQNSARITSPFGWALAMAMVMGVMLFRQ